MSEHATTTEHQPGSATVPENPVASPDFDQREVEMFGKDDGHAVGVIGKMLVGFFFYSLLVMLVVAWWTKNHYGQVSAPADHGAQAEESEE